MVAKHGTYIDGFAGPQRADFESSWAAQLVLESRPRWLRNLVFIEKDETQFAELTALIDRQPPRDKKKREPKRRVIPRLGDCNRIIPEILESGLITPKEAAFCLLDQRTFECDWATLHALASFPKTRHKIELLYFLPNAWLDRAIKSVKRKETVDRVQSWWGRSDWRTLFETTGLERARVFCSRIKKDYSYKSVKPWSIYSRAGGGRVMFFMIHATDHPQAPALMNRAYAKATGASEPLEQASLDLFGPQK